MITRSDGLSYIGITTNVNRRISEHRRSARFQAGIDTVKILAECESYDEAERLEESFITQYDTFRSGLNVTPHGKGKHGPEVKFNTLGYVYTESSRKK
jgi:hypothetical protein